MKFSKIGITFFSCWFSLCAHALSNDREKPMNCSADSVVVDQKADTSVLTGNVVITQGSTKLTGHVVTIYTKDKKIIKMVAVGNKKQQAYYTEEQNHQKGRIKAWADTISYQADLEIVTLEDDVRITRSDEVFTGKFIQYDKQKEKIDAHGDTKKMKQVEIILNNPKKTRQSSVKPKKK